jgi:hypothetical protein
LASFAADKAKRAILRGRNDKSLALSETWTCG